MADYLPHNDSEFNEWQSRFREALTERRAALGFSEAEVAALAALGPSGRRLWPRSGRRTRRPSPPPA